MSGYGQFARVYDILTGDVDYKARTEYLLKLFEKYGEKPTLLLDLACGTGGFSNAFAKKGIGVIGVDASEEMLSVARDNSLDVGADVLYLCQTAEELDLYGTVDGAVCCLDSLNHITDINNLKLAVNRISLFLEKGKLFIFDVNTVYKHEKILADNTFVIDDGGVYCVWQNFYDSKTRTTDILLDFFLKDGDKYDRFGDSFSERAYTESELQEILKEAGLKILAVYDDMTENPLTPTSERAIYVCEKL